MVIDIDGKGLTFSQRNLDVMNMTVLVIGVYDNFGVSEVCSVNETENANITNSTTNTN